MHWNSILSVLLWYTTNIGILCLNKALLSRYDWEYPICLTCLHMVSAIFWSEVMAQQGTLKKQELRPSQKKPIIILGTLFCISVVSGNISFAFIEISFTQAIGSTTPAFAAALGVLCLGKHEHWKTYLTLIPVILGAMVVTVHEPRFNLVGFLFSLNATGTRAARAVVQEMILQSETDRLDALNLLRFMSPVAAVQLFVATILMEPESFVKLWSYATTDSLFLACLLCNLVLAYFVNLGGMLVTRFNGALTLQVLGNMKGAVATAVSVMIFKNPVSTIAMFGYSICIAGVWAFSEMQKLHKPVKQDSAPKEKGALEGKESA